MTTLEYNPILAILGVVGLLCAVSWVATGAIYQWVGARRNRRKGRT